MDYTIRKFKQDDANFIMKLREDFAKELGVRDKISIKFVSIAMIQYLNENNNYSLYIAEVKKKVVGNGLIVYYKIPPSTANISGIIGYICNVYVAKKYRGYGIGTELMKNILKDAQEKGAGKIELLASKEGINVYKNLGFKVDTELTYMKKFL